MILPVSTHNVLIILQLSCYVLMFVCIVLIVEFKSDQFSTNESSGFAEIAVTISGGSSTTPISVMVTTSERSATGKGYINS